MVVHRLQLFDGKNSQKRHRHTWHRKNQSDVSWSHLLFVVRHGERADMVENLRAKGVDQPEVWQTRYSVCGECMSGPQDDIKVVCGITSYLYRPIDHAQSVDTRGEHHRALILIPNNSLQALPSSCNGWPFVRENIPMIFKIYCSYSTKSSRIGQFCNWSSLRSRSLSSPRSHMR